MSGLLTKALALWASAASVSAFAVNVPAVPRADAAPRYVLYFDQYHTAVLPNKTLTAGITHVVTAFANSSLFTTDPAGEYKPFKSVADVRALFDDGVKVSMAIGGWGDTEGFRVGSASAEARALYASNVAATLDRLGYDGVDIDWEYPGGNGYDYKQVPNDPMEAVNFPLFLGAIKSAIGDKELSIAVPALERDMMAYSAAAMPLIDAAVDAVNVMTYDLMNRRDTVTKHHTDIAGSLAAIDLYLQRGLCPSKMNLGIAFYAKYFTLPANSSCTGPLGCPITLAEAADGSDTGSSGAVTFEASSFPVPVPAKLTTSTDSTCGATPAFTCNGAPDGGCCSQYGYCGNTTAHCGTGCQKGYGTCTDMDTKSVAESFADAVANGKVDEANGAQWYIDTDASLFWTWDTPELVSRKFQEIIKARGLGGVMAWSLAEDSNDWGLLKAMKEGVASF